MTSQIPSLSVSTKPCTKSKRDSITTLKLTLTLPFHLRGGGEIQNKLVLIYHSSCALKRGLSPVSISR